MALIAIAAAVLTYHHFYTKPLLQENEDLKELAELEKQEMETQYRDFDLQYEMLQSQLSNDSLIAQIENERRHTQQLLEELERTKATDAAEIKRLKAEIASLREVLRSYIMQVDSLNRINQSLHEENTQIKEQISVANTQITNLSTERNQLKDKVNIAAQLDATGFWVTPKDKKSKDAKKVKDVKKLAFGFTIVKNVTAQNGQRTLYARILKPDNSVMGNKGTFPYENTTLEYTEKKYIDYTGEEEKITMYTDVTEFHQPWGKAYLSPVMDLHNNEIVAWSVSRHPNKALIDEMLDMLEPRLDGPALLHSDQGWQYQQRTYQDRIESLGLEQSMSRKATCLDNACIEGFFGHMKDEFYRGAEFESFEDLKLALDEYVTYWNTRRYQVALKGMSPVQYRGHPIRAA